MRKNLVCVFPGAHTNKVMGASAIAEPVAGANASSELRSSSLVWLSAGSQVYGHSLSEESVVVLDLQSLDLGYALDLLEQLDQPARGLTVLGFGDFEHIEAATPELAQFGVAFLARPEHLSDEEALSFVEKQLSSVYAPLERVGVEFLSRSAAEAPTGDRMKTSKSHQLLRNLFGEELAGVERRATEVADEYMNPPLAFNADQRAALLRLANRPETEVRSEDEQD